MDNIFIIDSDIEYDIPVNTEFLIIIPDEYTYPIRYSNLSNLKQLLLISFLTDKGYEDLYNYTSSLSPDIFCLMKKDLNQERKFIFQVSGTLHYPIPSSDLPVQDDVDYLYIENMTSTEVLDLNFFPNINRLVCHGINQLLINSTTFDADIELTEKQSLTEITLETPNFNKPLRLQGCLSLKSLFIESDIFDHDIDLRGCTRFKYLDISSDLFNSDINLTESINVVKLRFNTPNFNRPLFLRACVSLNDLDMYSLVFDHYLDLSQNTKLNDLLLNIPNFNNSNRSLDLRTNKNLSVVVFRKTIFNQPILFADECPELKHVTTEYTRMTHPIRFGKCDNLEYITLHHSELILTHASQKLDLISVSDNYPHKIDNALTKELFGINIKRLVIGKGYTHRDLDLHLCRELKYIDMKNNHDTMLFLPTKNDITTFSLTHQLTLTDVEYDDYELRVEKIYIGPPPKKILKLISTLPGQDRFLKIVDLGLLESFFVR